MRAEVARQVLLKHAGCGEDLAHLGFLPSLRPYKGLDDRHFHEVIESILSLGESFVSGETVDRAAVHCVWCLTAYGRRWGVDDKSMLVRNRLISPEDRDRLRCWIEIIEGIAMNLLAGMAPYETIHAYCEHNAQAGWGENYEFFLPLISLAINDVNLGDRIEGHTAAIAKLGPQASALRDVLLDAETREFDWYEPADRCTLEMRSYIRKAINSIDGANCTR